MFASYTQKTTWCRLWKWSGEAMSSLTDDMNKSTSAFKVKGRLFRIFPVKAEWMQVMSGAKILYSQSLTHLTVGQCRHWFFCESVCVYVWAGNPAALPDHKLLWSEPVIEAKFITYITTQHSLCHWPFGDFVFTQAVTTCRCSSSSIHQSCVYCMFTY